MIKDLIADIFSPSSTTGERLRALFLVFVLSGLLLLLGWIALYIADSVRTTNKTCVTTLESKTVIPARNFTTLAKVGKVMVPILNSYPESYEIRFKIESNDSTMSVEKKFFDQVENRTKLKVDYGFGRISKDCKPVNVQIQQ